MFSIASKTRARFARSFGRVLTASVLALSVMGTAACGGGDDKKDSTGPGAGIAGTYALKTIESIQVPVQIWEEESQGHTFKYQIHGGSVVLNANGTFTSTLQAREIIDDTPSDETLGATGTFTRNGESITFTDEDGDIQGTIKNGTLTLDLDLLGVGEGITFSFKK